MNIVKDRLEAEVVTMVSYVGQLGSAIMPPRRLTYAQIAEDLRSRIGRDLEYDIGDELPSYADLATLYSCSVSTITRAMALLRHDGLVTGEQGRGVFVNDPDDV